MKTTAKKWQYIAIVLDDESKERIFSTFGHIIPTMWTRYCDHITLLFNNHDDYSALQKEYLEKLIVGRRVDVLIDKIAFDDTSLGVLAAGVTLPKGVFCDNAHPHITLGCARGVKPKMANQLDHWVELKNPFTVNGIVQVVTNQKSK